MSKTKRDTTSKVVAKINNVEILIFDTSEKLVPVRPICDALGVAHQPQFERLKSDPILNSVVTSSMSTGADGKQYEMTCLPLKYVFGWLFRIDSRNVKEEARESVLKYQTMCYDALYDYFTGYAMFVEERQRAIDVQLDVVKQARKEFRTANTTMRDAELALDKLRTFTFDDYRASKMQLTIPFEEVEAKGGEA